MVEPGDTVSATLKKEFGEEAMNSLEATPEEKKIKEQVNELFLHGIGVGRCFILGGPNIFSVTSIASQSVMLE